MMRYRVVQPHGSRREEWTVQSEHSTIGDAFAALDALTAQMERTSAPTDAIELIVVNDKARE
jgi:hypothetical protein